MNTRIQSYMEVPHSTKHVLAKTSHKRHIDNFETHRCTVLTPSMLLKYTNTHTHTQACDNEIQNLCLAIVVEI